MQPCNFARAAAPATLTPTPACCASAAPATHASVHSEPPRVGARRCPELRGRPPTPLAAAILDLLRQRLHEGRLPLLTHAARPALPCLSSAARKRTRAGAGACLTEQAHSSSRPCLPAAAAAAVRDCGCCCTCGDLSLCASLCYGRSAGAAAAQCLRTRSGRSHTRMRRADAARQRREGLPLRGTCTRAASCDTSCARRRLWAKAPSRAAYRGAQAVQATWRCSCTSRRKDRGARQRTAMAGPARQEHRQPSAARAVPGRPSCALYLG
jgi:hypothetical protein